jgi:hypothetical protein
MGVRDDFRNWLIRAAEGDMGSSRAIASRLKWRLHGMADQLVGAVDPKIQIGEVPKNQLYQSTGSPEARATPCPICCRSRLPRRRPSESPPSKNSESPPSKKWFGASICDRHLLEGKHLSDSAWPALKPRPPALAARAPGLRGAGASETERHGGTDKILQGGRIDRVAFVDVDRAPDLPVEAGVE